MSFEAVVFDLYGTLYPNRRMYFRSALLYAANARLIRAFADVRRAIRHIRPIDDLHRLQAEMLAQKLSVTKDKARTMIDDIIYQQWERTFSGIKPYREVRATLLALKSMNLGIHLLTDFPVGRKLEYLGLVDLFDTCLSSEDSGYLKPNPEPFQMLADITGHSPEQMAFVGNDFRYDIEGAISAGYSPVYLSRRRSKRSGEVPEIRRFSELVEVIKTVERKN